jgi:hypothetical protein
MDETTRRRIAALLLVIGVVVVALAIADVGPFSDPPTEEERAQETVERFFSAASDGDFEEFCVLLSEPARDLIQQRAASLAEEQDLRGCQELVAALVGDDFDGVTVTVKQVSVSGPRARIEANLKFAGEAGHQPRTVFLDEVDGDWLVNEFD